MTPENRIALIGLGIDRQPAALAAHLAAHPAIGAADAVIGTADVLEGLGPVAARKIAIRTPIADLLAEAAALLDSGCSLAVLTGGDPLFYSLGSSFLERFGPEKCVVYPGVSSPQYAAAKLGIPWGSLRSVSVHGRKGLLPLAHAALHGGPVCLLTDGVNTPAAAARFLFERGVTGCTVSVAARLGSGEESFWHGTLTEAAAGSFPEPNLAFFLPDPSLPGPLPLCPGQPESAYVHEGGRITKWPVRAAALAALRIEPHHVVWDLGSGSGSVAVEAASLARRGHVVAVERDTTRIRHIEENRRRFGAANLDILHASLPLCLEKDFVPRDGTVLHGNALPQPDRIFIGGGLGGDAIDAQRLIRLAWDHLLPGGRIVVSCVLLNNFQLARDALQSLDPDAGVLLVQAGYSAPLGNDAHLQAINPVFCIAAQKRS